jgi:hypothetical protein
MHVTVVPGRGNKRARPGRVWRKPARASAGAAIDLLLIAFVEPTELRQITDGPAVVERDGGRICRSS